MKNYKIRYNRPVIQPEESRSLENFDELLTEYNTPRGTNWKNIFRSIAMFIAISGIVFLGIYKDAYEFEFPEVISNSDIIISEQTPPSVIEEPAIKTNDISLGNEELKDGPSAEIKEINSTALPNESSPETDNSTVVADQDGGFLEAEPIDGFPALYSYLEEQLKYPDAALEDGLEGNVIVKFVIDTAGNPIKVIIEKSLHEVLDSTAIDLVNNMPKWNPARLNGEAIESTHRIPLFFQIENKEE